MARNQPPPPARQSFDDSHRRRDHSLAAQPSLDGLIRISHSVRQTLATTPRRDSRRPQRPTKTIFFLQSVSF